MIKSIHIKKLILIAVIILITSNNAFAQEQGFISNVIRFFKSQPAPQAVIDIKEQEPEQLVKEEEDKPDTEEKGILKKIKEGLNIEESIEQSLPPMPPRKPKAITKEEIKDIKITEDKEPDITMAIKAKSLEPVFIDGDIDETIELPNYPEDAIQIIGENITYKVREEDTLIDISQHFGVGFIEIFAANPDIDTWVPGLNREVVLPYSKIIPRTEKQEGIIVNLAQMRLYYFKEKGKKPITFPIGIGREGLQTPVGQTRIAWKRANPTWSPTDRMREAKPWLPRIVPAGINNPLGVHALYLGWPTFLIHGTNKPWAIGRRVSSGCMRMYPEHVAKLFEMVEPNTRVTIVNQPILIAERDGDIYLEANPTFTQGDDIEMKGSFEPKALTEEVKNVIKKAVGDNADKIDWIKAEQVMLERRGHPIRIN